ncbi:hypothetical protein M441DRAFT_275649 [Trichoderma asperellum CBS 433.97]|uniref:Uncharacterized protein n=1 Tax=Trichoderma asperellum (strain ATCC 204424 / CBS 433.97 / NBRC 101777) TaxID=1042311 RepID=A0A2T3YUR6_TRIA4|nr:hypothetical protein M441DRAFT_275649 [Trichoderma asperellum CBS 433.97]PTB36320.1 hypothetical protein M441DRAFT_275649 [Trichoderma asperellum CBS 433.97]
MVPFIHTYLKLSATFYKYWDCFSLALLDGCALLAIYPVSFRNAVIKVSWQLMAYLLMDGYFYFSSSRRHRRISALFAHSYSVPSLHRYLTRTCN